MFAGCNNKVTLLIREDPFLGMKLLPLHVLENVISNDMMVPQHTEILTFPFYLPGIGIMPS